MKVCLRTLSGIESKRDEQRRDASKCASENHKKHDAAHVTTKFWSAHERTVIAGMENYLDKSDDIKLEKRSWSF